METTLVRRDQFVSLRKASFINLPMRPSRQIRAIPLGDSSASQRDVQWKSI